MRGCRSTRSLHVVALGVGGWVAGAAPPALAQLPREDSRLLISGDVALASEYNWRGLTRVSGWVLQPDLYVAVPIGSVSRPGADRISFSLSAGALGYIELSDAALDEHADRGEFGFGEINPWVQVGAGLGEFDFALGATRYFYRGDLATFPGARTAESSSTELFLDARVRGRRFDARGTWWLDIDEVGGSYVETAATMHVPFLPFFPSSDPVLAVLDLGVTLGWSAGQATNVNDPLELAHFAQNGLTHIAFSLSSPLILAGVSLEPSFNVQANRDDATRMVRPGADSRLSVWWGLVVSPTGALGLGGGS